MNLDWKKYKRFFTFGCSFTCYVWPTWADIIHQEMLDSEFYNFGRSGSGNTLISYRIAEANNRYQFTDTDLIMVMFTTFCREDRWVSDQGWLTGGNIFSNQIYPKSWVKEFADEKGYLIRDAAVLDLTIKYLNNLSSTSISMMASPFVTNSEICDITSEKPNDIISVYKNMFTQIKPSFYEIELNGNWTDLRRDYIIVDGHPAPIRYYNYLEKLGFNLSPKTKEYAIEMTDILKTIKIKENVPLYFPEQDVNVTNSRTKLF